MLKSGLIVGGVTLLLAIGATLISPICVPCVALVAGLAAGYLGGMFDKPVGTGGSARTGAGAGAIGGLGALGGHLVGAVGNALILGPEGTARFVEQLGLPSSGDPAQYYLTVFGSGCCLGLLEIALMAGLGALGGLLWYQTAGKNMAPPPAPAM
jgi:hypothetical protein